MDTLPNVFIKQADITPSIYHAIPKPSIFREDNEQHLIISTNENHSLHEGNPAGIYELNIKESKMKILCEYNKQFKACMQGQCIDGKNNILYLFGGGKDEFYQNEGSICLYNLKTKQIDYDTTNKLKDCGTIPNNSSFYIAEFHQMYALNWQGDQFIFDIHKNEVFQYNNNNQLKYYSKPLYIPINKQLMIFGADNDDTIFYRCVHHNISHKWNLHCLKMPHLCSNNEYDFCIAFTNFVFVFYFSFKFKGIYIIDITRNQLFQTEYFTPKCISIGPQWFNSGFNTFVVKETDSNYIHLLSFKKTKTYHWKCDLYDLIPKQLHEIYHARYEMLIIGFTKEQENDNIIPTMPIYLKKLISKYYPVFI